MIGDPAWTRYTPRAQKVVELSLREALQLGCNYIGTEHILLALVREGQGVASKVLTEDLGLELEVVRKVTIQRLATANMTHLQQAKIKARIEELQAEIDGLRTDLGSIG